MAIILDPTEAAIRRGIKTVGVGKKGSQAMDAHLTAEVLADLKANKVRPAEAGAFFAGLLAKGVLPHEAILEGAYQPGILTNMDLLVNTIAHDAPEAIRHTCVDLLQGKTLSRQEAFELGRFLFADLPGDGARGLVASLLRVRYETDDEYEGIWQAMQETILPVYKGSTPEGEPIVQIAEPFDGNDHSYLITPIIAGYIQAEGYRVITMIGRNSGPKLVMNLYDVMKLLPDTKYLKQTDDLNNGLSSMGYFCRQEDVSTALDRWVNVRHQTIKRPFLATLEKFIKPFDARIIITSAFHPPYGEKMITIGERAGFLGGIVVRNGIEGSIGFSLKRPIKLLLSARQTDGSYLRHEIIVDPQAVLDKMPATEEQREILTAKENARLIQQYLNVGSSGDEWFDARVKLTCHGIQQALEWLNKNIKD